MAWHEDDEFWQTFKSTMFANKWERTPREVDELLDLLELQPPGPVRDLCCGPGRHSIELSRRGFDVVGVDRRTAICKTRGTARLTPV